MEKLSTDRIETKSDASRERSERVPISTTVEFICDFDIVQASGVDLSEGGICFDTEGALPFEVQLDWEGEPYRYRAHLVWMKQLSSGGYRIGLKFVVPAEEKAF